MRDQETQVCTCGHESLAHDPWPFCSMIIQTATTQADGDVVVEATMCPCREFTLDE